MCFYRSSYNNHFFFPFLPLSYCPTTSFFYTCTTVGPQINCLLCFSDAFNEPLLMHSLSNNLAIEPVTLYFYTTLATEINLPNLGIPVIIRV